MTPEQFDRWMAYSIVEPIGLEKLYQVLGLVGAGICNGWGMPVTPSDFIPGSEADEDEADDGTDAEDDEDDSPPQPDHALKMTLQLIAARHNASILGG